MFLLLILKLITYIFLIHRNLTIIFDEIKIMKIAVVIERKKESQ
jgi:hypothetical protein